MEPTNDFVNFERLKRLYRLGYTAEQVLVVICCMAGPKGETVRPLPVRRLAQNSGRSDNTVDGAIKKMIADGLIKRVKSAQPGRGKAAEYDLTPLLTLQHWDINLIPDKQTKKPNSKWLLDSKAVLDRIRTLLSIPMLPPALVTHVNKLDGPARLKLINDINLKPSVDRLNFVSDVLSSVPDSIQKAV